MSAVNAYFVESQIVEINGKTNNYNGLEIDGVAATGASVVDNHFCVTCGSTVYWDLTLASGQREIGIAVGNFVDPAFPVPVTEYFTTLRHQWVSPVPAADHFDTHRTS